MLAKYDVDFLSLLVAQDAALYNFGRVYSNWAFFAVAFYVFEDKIVDNLHPIDFMLADYLSHFPDLGRFFILLYCFSLSPPKKESDLRSQLLH